MKIIALFPKSAFAAAALCLLLAACGSQPPAPVEHRGANTANTYVVKSGDTLYGIARTHGMDYRELITLNSIESPDSIAPGRVLKVRPPSTANRNANNAGVASTPVTSGAVEVKPLGAVTESTPITEADALKREPKAGKIPYSEQAWAQAQNQIAPPVVVATTPAAATEGKSSDAVKITDDIKWVWPVKGKILSTYNQGSNKGLDIGAKAGTPIVAAAEGKVVYSGTGLRGYGKLVIIKHNSAYLSAYAHNQTIFVKEGQSISQGQKIAEMGNTDADEIKLHFEIRLDGKPVDPQKYLP